MPSTVILIADGTEEIEFTITYNTLVHAGVTCCSAFVPAANASVGRPYATRSRGIHIMYNAALETRSSSSQWKSSYDALVIPGGVKGVEMMSTNLTVQNLLRDFLAGQDRRNDLRCSQAALTANLPRQPLTSHPSVKAQLENNFEYSKEPVVVSNTVLFLCSIYQFYSSRGPGTAFPFALTLVELLCGADKRAEVCAPMVFPPNTPF
ncbi:class I glutamine amidotransferase-like protein [Mycena olivaceomarginata]|nr:class I glutamine amidotransferase-like protein [Mycena olivaceomarginata]